MESENMLISNTISFFPPFLIERHGTFFSIFFYWHIFSPGIAQNVETSYAGIKEQNVFSRFSLQY